MAAIVAGAWFGACEKPTAYEVAAINSWVGSPFGSAVGGMLGPEGARIFPVWGDNDSSSGPEAILVVASIFVDLGTPARREIRLYVDPATNKVETVVVSLDPPVGLSEIEGLLGENAERRLCEPDPESDVLDSPLVPGEGGGAYNIAVFAGQRIVAEMFQQRDTVDVLRWVGGQKSLDGCP